MLDINNDLVELSKTGIFMRMKTLISSLNDLLVQEQPNLMLLALRIGKIQLLAEYLDMD